MLDLEDFLAHYGIKGMHWGVRRNLDASTGRVESKASAETKVPSVHTKGGLDGNVNTSADHERAAAAFTKAQERGISSLSNEELKAIATRAKAEKGLLELSGEQKSDIQKQIEQLRAEKDLRQLQGERALATRSKGAKLTDALLSAAASAAQAQAQEYGSMLVKNMLGQNTPDLKKDLQNKVDIMKLKKEHATLQKELAGMGLGKTGPIKVNPSAVKITPTVLKP